MRCVYREWNREMIQCMSVSAKERESWRRRGQGETMVDGVDCAFADGVREDWIVLLMTLSSVCLGRSRKQDKERKEARC